MKIKTNQFEAFLAAAQPGLRAALVYGPDQGLVSERARRLAQTRVENLSDPFRVSELSRRALSEEPARLLDEAAALALGGGARVVRVRGVSDEMSSHFAALLDRSGETSLVVAEAGPLGPRSSLRKLFESAGNAAAIACYADDEAALAKTIRTVLAGHGLRAENGAMDYLLDSLSGDRLVTRSELEKLALYMGDRKLVTEADATASVGDNAVVTLDGLVFAVGAGDHAAAGRALRRLALDGVGPVRILRATARHLERLHLVAGRVAAGARLDRALAALWPKPHFTRQSAFRAQAESWPVAQLATAMSLVMQAEIECKTTGMPAPLIASLALMRVTAAARRLRIH